MGAITFSLDPSLVDALQIELELSVLVETGTFQGDTIELHQSSFDKIFSVELSEALWSDAVKRFQHNQHIQILHGNSQDKLRELVAELKSTGVLYWLDAHWCVASDTAGELSQCPLLEELQAIGSLNAESVVLIDDARLFLAPPLAPHEISHWPSFHQIVTCLLSISEEHELMVVNDVIAFFPSKVKPALEQYAQQNGIDWLVAANCMKSNETFIQQIVEKEAVIQQLILNSKNAEGEIFELHNTVAEKESQLQKLDKDLNDVNSELAEMQVTLIDKESVIQVMAKAITAYRIARACNPKKIVSGLKRRVKTIFRPRLGNLNQYSPRLLVTESPSVLINQLVNTPIVSIVTPSFQQGGLIERTIQSVLNQEYPNLEYYVQDGGSKDDTTSVIKRYERKLSGWKSIKDNGQSQAINLGFANTTGEIMAWLNSDDLLLPGSLALVVDYFNKHPDVDVVYGNRLLINEDDMEIGRWIMPGHDSAVLSWVDYVPQETMFWRRRIWDKAGGGIDESFRFAMDWDLLVRFREEGAKFAHLPHFLGAFRIHQQQKTSASISEIGYQEMDRIRERLLGRVPTRYEIRKNIMPFMFRHVAFDLLYRIKVRLGLK